METTLRVGVADSAFIGSIREFFSGARLIKGPEDVDNYDLVIFTGGSDIDPKRYGTENNGMCYTDPARDEREFAIFKAADEKKKAILGICRGLQLINVAREGTLVQDLWSAGKPHNDPHDLTWTMDKKKLKACFPTNSVNSYHHQGIGRLGRDLAIVASYNGVAEIILGKEYILAVQFHPEFMGSAGIPFFELVNGWALNCKETEDKKKEEVVTVTEPAPASASDSESAAFVTAAKKTIKAAEKFIP